MAEAPRFSLFHFLRAGLLVLAVALLPCVENLAGENPKVPAPGFAQELKSLISERQQLDRTLWGREVLAQEYEKRFQDFWDTLRASTDKLKALGELPFETLESLQAADWVALENGVERATIKETRRTTKRDDVIAHLDRLSKEGWSLIQSEWHHERFQPHRDFTATSEVAFKLHCENRSSLVRWTIDGLVEVSWKRWENRREAPVPQSLKILKAKILRRVGPPAFVSVASIDARQLGQESLRIHPLMVQDLNDDGLSEVILGGVNLVHWNLGQGRFKRETFLAHWRGEIGEGGVLADFTGDGHLDFLCVTARDRLPTLFPGSANGRFPHPPRFTANVSLTTPSAITAGDIDGDGDLDAWISQYKGAYTEGQMPTPYYDAIDGYPSFLLLNDGHGGFTDGTHAAGLDVKRNRRTYAASFVDLDHDRDLDLLVVSDFSGADIYRNDGDGHFTDVRDDWLEEWRNFGMGHAFGDYDGDGRLDFYVIGMSSTTMRRLESMGLHRPGFEGHAQARPIMGYGNRMYLGGEPGGAFRDPAFRGDVARTGWSWGVSSFDFDNDGDEDIYIANGFMSGESCRDYCTTFWRHDIYTGGSKPDPVVAKLLNISQYPIVQASISWNGFEKNTLLMNDNNAGFHNAAFLMGAALPQDCRAVVSDDLDGDGRRDLLVVEEWWGGQFKKGQILHVLSNRLVNDNRWIGFRLSGGGPREHALGATVTLKLDNGTRRVRAIVAGDSFYSQHAPVAHFGLGPTAMPLSVRIDWVSGRSLTLRNPRVGQYHRIRPDDAESPPNR